MLCALSVVLVAIIHFPLIPAAPFLEYDPANIPILIAAFLYGPWCGVAVTAVVSVIQGVTVSASSGIIGIVMHFLATGVYCIVAGSIYQKNKSIKTAVLGLVCGGIAMTAVMCACNLLLTPMFMGVPVESVVGMLLPIIVPFNLLKAAINSVVTFFVYKPISRLFAPKQEAAVKSSENAGKTA